MSEHKTLTEMDQTNQGQTDKRLPLLDAYRGLAAILVLLYHYLNIYPTRANTTQPTAEWGKYGVHIFFAISGYVILKSAQSAKSSRVFMMQRSLRLMPTFWCCMTLTYIVTTLLPLPWRSTSIKDYFLNLPLLTSCLNLALPDSLEATSIDGVYWSLERESLFYIAVAGLIATKLITRVEMLCFGWIVAKALTYALPQKYRSLADLLLNTDYAEFFTIGIVSLRIAVGGPSIQRAGLIILSVLATTLPHLSLKTLVAIVTVLALQLPHRLPSKSGLLKPLMFIGAISYPLYLLHQNIGFSVLLHPLKGANPTLALSLTTLLSLSLATALHYSIEVFATERLKARLFGKTRPSGNPAT